jgi:predicted PurR-regulated permease PerM
VASLGFYWLADQQRIERLWLSLLPLGARTRVRAVWAAVYREVGIYVRGEVAIIGLTMLALLALFTLLDLPGGVLLAIAGGLAQVVPLLGPPLAVLPGALAALTQGPLSAALALAGALGALLAIRLMVAPRVFREGINTNPVLVVVLILALFEAGGLGLALLGPPLAAAIQATTRVLAGEGRALRAQVGPAQLDSLANRLDGIAAAVAPDRPDAARLQGLIERARRLLAEAAA